jgi:hypothetical protein
MATTYLQAINRVLEKIGEEQVSAAATSITETYELLVGSFIQDIKEQIEEAHDWRALRQTNTSTIAAQGQSVVVTEADERSRVVRIAQQNRSEFIPLVFDITDANAPMPLMEMDLSELIYRDTVDPNNYNEPAWFAFDNSSGDVLELYVYPRPSGARTIQHTLVIPQARFEPSDLTSELKIPIRPLIVGATWYALEERGEELGTAGQFNEQRFMDALNTAIARDADGQGDNIELVRT